MLSFSKKQIFRPAFFLAGLIFLATFACLSAYAINFVVPRLTGPVVDQANLISARDKARLEELIRSIHQSGKIQPQVLIMKSLSGQTIEQASIQVVDQWKLGGESSDNGVLVLMAIEERKVRIEVGQGLEGEIPDIVASRVIRETMTPFFQRGNMASGLEAGIYQLAALAGVGEGSGFQAPPSQQIPEWKIFLMLLALMLFAGLFSAVAHHNGLRGTGSGGFGGPFGGGGGFGGRGGGGWSGGGGGFSGGGASGGW